MSPERVPFLDMRRRIQSIRAGLESEVGRVFERGRFILGESGAEIERAFAKYSGAAHGVAVGSGTDALRLALEGLGVGAGDEVVTTANTCAPTIAAILDAGAIPVLVDVDPATFTMDPEHAEAALSPGPSASCRFTSTASAPTSSGSPTSPRSAVSSSWRIARRRTAPSTAGAVRARGGRRAASASTRRRTSERWGMPAWW